MRRDVAILQIPIVLAIQLVSLGTVLGAATERIASPDGKVSVAVSTNQQGRLVIQVERNGRRVLEPSPLGVTVDGVDLGAGVSLGGSADRYQIDERYPHLGHVSEIHNHGRGMRIPIRHPQGQWTLEVRAYDDGAAWRYVIPGEGERRVTGEATTFRLPAASSYWSHSDTDDYEALYKRFKAAEPAERTMTMPLTVELPAGGYACIVESDIMHYSGMTLRAAGDGRFHGVFEDDAEGWTMQGAFHSPWRVVIAVDDLNGLVNSTIIYNVAPAPDPALFPDGARTEWIRPGKSLWQWWFYSWDGLRWDRQKQFVDAAAALNCEYYLVDDGWENRKYGWITEERTKWDSLRELATYARERGVDLWVWRAWTRVRDPGERDSFFKTLSEIGIAGVKIDFMESESHERLAFYQATLADAARYKLMVNFHGANKSAGENRSWPNEMSREAVYGLEQNKGAPRITLEHYTTLPFTAFIGGAKDFTPTTYRKGNAGTTQAFQLATAVLYTSPFLCWANRPDEFLQSPSLELLRTVPTVWDETIVLPETAIGQFVAFARRNGEDWWVAIISGTREPRTYDLKLDFLGEGEWTLLAAQDTPGDPWPLQMDQRSVSADQVLNVKLEAAGGYVGRFKRINAGDR